LPFNAVTSIMSPLVVLTLLVAAANGRSLGLDYEWATFKVKHAKNYMSLGEEYIRRFIWEDNLKFIARHNAEADAGLHTFWVGENQFADMTTSEFAHVMNTYVQGEVSGAQLHVPNKTADDAVDWRTKGYVTPIKNQGHCGSCWAFSTTGSLEGQHFKKAGKLVSLSEQNLVDCSKREGNKGCKGGLMDKGFEYVKMNGGIDTEESYPYKGKDGICEFKQADVGATLTSFKDVRGGEEALAQAVSEVGPISVAMDAGHQSFQLYKKGIYKERACSSKRLDHGVLAVGYGSEGEKDYWIVKNSWGTVWGQEGYFWLAKGENNMCGLATQPSYPIV